MLKKHAEEWCYAPGTAAPKATTAPQAAVKPAQSVLDHAPGTGPVNVHTTPVPAAQAVQSLAAVKTMQAAIVQFVNVISANEIFNADNGRSPLSVFLLNRYIKPTDTAAAGSLTKDLSANEHSTSNTDLKEAQNLQNLILTTARIGTPNGTGHHDKKEEQPDGDWGPRTNQSLNNIAAIIQGVVGFAKDMGIDLGQNYVEKFKDLIPVDLKQVQDKSKQAEQLTQFIKYFTDQAAAFKDKIMDNKQFAGLMSGTEPLFETSVETSLTKDEEEEKNTRFGIPGTGLVSTDLSDKEAFKNWLERNKMPAGNDAEILSELNKIEQTINTNVAG